MRQDTDHFSPNIKIVISEVVVWRGQKSSSLGGQVWGRAPWVTQGGNCCPMYQASRLLSLFPTTAEVCAKTVDSSTW
jgi:hypothetical protein